MVTDRKFEYPCSRKNTGKIDVSVFNTLDVFQRRAPRPLPLLYLDHLLARSPKGSDGRDHILKCAGNAMLAVVRSNAQGTLPFLP